MSVNTERVRETSETARQYLLDQRTSAGHWVGQLSTSPLSTATAVMALHQVLTRVTGAGAMGVSPSRNYSSHTGYDVRALQAFIHRGCAWLIANQNADGGWGDTDQSVSNISTTMLCHATLVATRQASDASVTTLTQGDIVTREQVISLAAAFIEKAGGVPALLGRYGKDKTFSVPILTHCALAGLVPWNQVPRLPFELACIPASWYAAAKFPVVSYALPALIAIGQVRHFHGPTRNPITRSLRWLARDRSLAVLQRIQPPNGGFLEAAPLTSFVCMSLAGMGLVDHPVVRQGIHFLIRSVRDDGSWPIDTNLATWTTTLSVNALGNDLPAVDREPILKWLLNQQYQQVHPYTNAAPGGWAWTDLPGGVPDADDTPGAVLAIGHLAQSSQQLQDDCDLAMDNGLNWLLGLQNRDGGFPTFCRGWGTLPFDRSSADITAHALRALHQWIQRHPMPEFRYDHEHDHDLDLGDFNLEVWCKIDESIQRGFLYLEQVQRSDGSWLPLWFGNQHVREDENPVYGTSRVLKAFRDGDHWNDQARRGAEWLRSVQNADGGWGGDRGAPSSVEETALALEVLLERGLPADDPIWRGVEWLMARIEDGSWIKPSPIGFYFAKLWYHEALYPVIWTVAALRKAVAVTAS